MSVDVLLGLQWGDEGKGKIVDVLTPRYDIVARFQGGPNAGHTLEFEGRKHILHTIPSGIFHPRIINVIGNGVVLDPSVFMKELESVEPYASNLKQRLIISSRAHLITPTHRLLDWVYETAKGKAKIGSTLKGIGPTYTDKIARNGLRVGDILSPDFKQLYNRQKDYHLKLASTYKQDIDFELNEDEWFKGIDLLKKFTITETEYYINNALAEGKSILAEGAQGSLLDIDFGSYPFVTSSNTSIGGVCTGLGIAPNRIGKVMGLFKAYCTRVGSGPFPSELHDETGEQLRKEGNEFGSTTGRPRRCGWLDLVALKYAVMLNGVTELVMTKADVLDGFDTIQAAVHYRINGTVTKELPFNIDRDDLQPEYRSFKGWKTTLNKVGSFKNLPDAAKNYIQFIEEYTGVHVKFVSVGPDRKAILEC